VSTPSLDPVPDPDAATHHTPGDHLSPAFPGRAPWGTADRLRAWQAEALNQYFATEPRDFLVNATPGAGKTTFALRLAKELRDRGTIDRITVVAPTEHLKRQWADAADRVGLRLNPEFRNADGWFARHWHGVAVTYAQVAVKAEVHRRIAEGGRTLVILDEVHHGGDALSWGDAIREAFGPAARRLSLTGTPFRSDTAPIPFVQYVQDQHGVRTSQTDFDYGYGRALADGVVRPVIFLAYAGMMRWRTKMGDEMEAGLGEGDTKDIASQAWRTALSPEGEWIPSVLAAADRRLSEVRESVPDAGGLVIATDQTNARAYARILHGITGQMPTIVLSDEKESSDRIDAFSKGTDRWLVAVRMVSEGVDVPRLQVGVYATSSSTPLFFAQAIGRFVRTRRRGEVASIFLPNVLQLTGLAGEMEKHRDHALDRRDDGEDVMWDDDLMDSANREEKSSDSLEEQLFSFQALGSTAHFDRVLYQGHEFGSQAEVGSEEELEFLGLPGILEPTEVAELLKQRHQKQQRTSAARRKANPETPAPQAMHRTLKEQRQLLNSLVGIWAKSSNQPHGMVHAELRRVCGGPAVPQCSVAQLQTRIERVRAWTAGRPR
jgi:superfamily II DNA or RNA helicase